ncbi:MAG: hypothetical protein IJU51_07585 [Clostridia bacterium]|nr:hypothetical protein [Clostridia bacterium]
MKNISKAISRIGLAVTVESTSGLKSGKAVISPMRYYQMQWGGMEHAAQGRTEPKRFAMFCSRELLEGSGYGSIIYQGSSRYVLIWKDDYTSRVGCYTKACLRKVTEEDEDE